MRPRYTLNLCLAACVFLLGATGVESVGGAVEMGALGEIPFGLSWGRLIAIEEFLEMLGVILLIRTLLLILASEQSPYRNFARPA